MRQQLQTMLELQDAINKRMHPKWRTQHFEWCRAIWVECAELMEHFGWKWWKKQSQDIEQVKLELVDIWHFGLSLLLENGTELAVIEERLKRGLKAPVTMDFRNTVESLAGHVLVNQSFDIECFGRLMRTAELNFDTLYTDYIGKNVLNFFRQDKGYKEGTYQKVWNGREDNEHLVDIIQTLNTSADDFKDQLYRALEDRYQTCLIAS